VARRQFQNQITIRICDWLALLSTFTMSEAPGNLNIPDGMDKPSKFEMSSSQQQRAVSMGALSDMQHQTTAMELIGLQVWHQQILKVYFPLCFCIILMSCMWGFIIAQRGEYDNPNGSWQACLLNADYTYIPLNSTVTQIGAQIAIAKAGVRQCFIDNVLDGTCDGTCATSLITNCLSQLTPPAVDVQDIQLPTGHFMDGFSYLGVQAIIFSSIAHGTLYRSLRHPSWLLSAAFLLCWFLVAMFSYYTVGPILPVPNGINSTLLTYLMYTGSYSKFRDFNNGDNHCHYALRVAWTYEIFILCLCFTVFLGIIISIYAERIRYKSPNKPHYTHLKYTRAPVVFSALAGVAYIFFIASKITSAATELHAVGNFDVPLSEAGKGFWYPSIWFPFAVPTLDITTIVGICCVMSVLRGYTIQSLSAFRMAFMCAVVYALSIYPGLVGAYNFYDYNNFYNDTDCKNYFLGGETSHCSFTVVRCWC
jgi:hypothetical protein